VNIIKYFKKNIHTALAQYTYKNTDMLMSLVCSDHNLVIGLYGTAFLFQEQTLALMTSQIYQLNLL